MSVERVRYDGMGFSAVKAFSDWRIGMIHRSPFFSRFTYWERHMQTDEVFILLSGHATLYTKNDEGAVERDEMVPDVLYDVRQGTWHYIIIEPESTVIVVENRDTGCSNSEYDSAL